MPSESRAATGNGPYGLISIIAAAGVLVWQGVHAVAQASLLTSQSYEGLATLTGVGNVIQAVLSIAAIVFGAIGLARRGSKKALPGIGLGAGAAVLASLALWALIYPAIVTLLY